MTREEILSRFDRLLTIMDELREKCPWDREQTWESIRHLTIEETYELSDALLEHNVLEVEKELGDLLLHIVFYSKIASEQYGFDMGGVIEKLCDKLVRRHPHIYGNIEANDADTVKQNWEQIKLKEKGEGRKSVLDGIPKTMPSLVQAYRIQEKVAQVGFDWPNTHQVIEKVVEELEELRKETSIEKKTQEFGDLLFAMVNYARHEGINPDDALEYTNKKFKKRFHYIEDQAQSQNLSLKNISLDQMEQWWQEAKK